MSSATDYERLRQEKIARNQQILQQLGLLGSPNKFMRPQRVDAAPSRDKSSRRSRASSAASGDRTTTSSRTKAKKVSKITKKPEKTQAKRVAAPSQTIESNGSPLVVVQCPKCHQILSVEQNNFGSCLTTNKEFSTQFLVLSAMYGVEIDEKHVVSTETVDFGCAYRSVRCAECSTAVARVYSCVSADLSAIRRMFALPKQSTMMYVALPFIRFRTQQANHRHQIGDHVSLQALAPVYSLLRQNLSDMELSAAQLFIALDDCRASLTHVADAVRRVRSDPLCDVRLERRKRPRDEELSDDAFRDQTFSDDDEQNAEIGVKSSRTALIRKAVIVQND